MTNAKKLWILLDAVFLLVFNIVFFVLGGAQQDQSIWIAYGFIHFAYLMLLLTPLFVHGGSSSTLFGMSLYTISFDYFAVTFLCGLMFMIWFPDKGTLSLVTQVIITGIYAICFLAHMLANEKTGEALVVHDRELQFVKQSASQLQAVLNRTQNSLLRKKAERAYDLARTSQVKTDQSVHGLENVILNNIELLLMASSAHDDKKVEKLLDQIIEGIEERQRLLKLQQ